MLCYRYIILMVPPTYYMLISQLNSTSTFFLFYNFTLFFRLFYFTLFLSIYINYMYIALFLHITIKNKNHPCRCALWNSNPKNKTEKIMIPNPKYVLKIPNCATTKNQSTQSTKQSAGFLHNITLWWHGTYPVQPWTTIRCSHSR